MSKPTSKRATAKRGAKKIAPNAKKPAPAKKPASGEVAAKAIAKAVVAAVTGDKPSPAPVLKKTFAATEHDDERVPPIYFESRTGKYWLRYPDGAYVQFDSGNIDLHLRSHGLSTGKTYDGELNGCERARLTAQRERMVVYAGPLAGYEVGLHTLASGDKILVTKGRRVWPDNPKSDPAFVVEFEEELLGREQSMRLHLWRKYALASLARHDFRPRQAVIMAGPATCGKSFSQVITSYTLGCRTANPAKFFWEGEQFTSALAASEHWSMTETGKADMRRRKAYGELLKQFCVEPIMEVRMMHRDPIFIATFRAIDHTLNCQHEYVMTLPVVDDSTAGKMMLFLAKEAKHKLSEDRGENIRRLEAAMPGYIRWLAKLECPKAFHSPREGVSHYHHPELLDIISDVSHSTHLLHLIDAVLFRVDKTCNKIQERAENEATLIGGDPDRMQGRWVGTASQLERELRADAQEGWNVERLLDRSPNAAGNMLARLKSEQPTRFWSRKDNGVTVWTIDLPAHLKPKE